MPLTTPRAAFRNLKGKTASSSSLKCAESKDPARRIVRTQQAAPKLHNKAALPLPRGQSAATAKWQFSECLYGGAYGAVSFGAKEVVTEEIHKGTLRPRLTHPSSLCSAHSSQPTTTFVHHAPTHHQLVYACGGARHYKVQGTAGEVHGDLLSGGHGELAPGAAAIHPAAPRGNQGLHAVCRL